MKDAERIYALYVQANPVPDPDLLATTRDEIVLLPIERSEDMITQEPVEKRPFAGLRRRNVLVTAGAFAAIVVVGLVTVVLVNGGESGPVAAGDARPEVVFDGATCTYEGPAQIEGGTVEFTMINEADVSFFLAGWLLEGEALAAELIRTPVGSDMATTATSPRPALAAEFAWSTNAGDSQTRIWPLPAGTYLLDCTTQDHLWRPAQIDVVSP